MITMLWLYLVTNDIIKLTGAENIIVYLAIFYVVVDWALFYALYSRVRKK